MSETQTQESQHSTVKIGLQQLSERAKICTACHLSEKRTNVVFGEGNPHSPLVLIGEGPGEQEDKQGRPFVGPAGQLLDRALLDNGLNRDDVYICNIVKCRACDWSDGVPTNRAPNADEIQACSQWLTPQLKLISPRVILCLGAPSANTMIKKGFQITKERGQLFPCNFARYAIATLHPAYVLRQGGLNSETSYAELVSDIGMAWITANL